VSHPSIHQETHGLAEASIRAMPSITSRCYSHANEPDTW